MTYRRDMRHHFLTNVDVQPTQVGIFQSSHGIVNPQTSSGGNAIPFQNFSQGVLLKSQNITPQQQTTKTCRTCRKVV